MIPDDAERIHDTAAYHLAEAERIQAVLDGLGPEFAEDGIVKWVLTERVKQERERAEKARRR